MQPLCNKMSWIQLMERVNRIIYRIMTNIISSFAHERSPHSHSNVRNGRAKQAEKHGIGDFLLFFRSPLQSYFLLRPMFRNQTHWINVLNRTNSNTVTFATLYAKPRGLIQCRQEKMKKITKRTCEWWGQTTVAHHIPRAYRGMFIFNSEKCLDWEEGGEEFTQSYCRYMYIFIFVSTKK